MSVKEKLATLGLTLPTAAAPVAAYVPAVKSGNLIFTAGQLPVVDGKLVKEGKVGSDVSAEEAKDLAQICALNALAAISLVAVLACFPFTSPKTLSKNSLAPFTTPGIAVKPGAQLTKPPTLTTLST